MTKFIIFHHSEVRFKKETSDASLEKGKEKDSSCDCPICSYLCLKNPFLDSVSGIMFCTTGKSTAQHKQRYYTLMRFHKIYSKQIFNVMSKVLLLCVLFFFHQKVLKVICITLLSVEK